MKSCQQCIKHVSFSKKKKKIFQFCHHLTYNCGYRSGGPGSIPGTTKKEKKVVGLERDPLSLVSTTEELLDKKVAAPV
jgi:hypothetical protein